MKKLIAEVLGTFVLVLFGCGAAILAGPFIGFAGIAAAFGLSVLVMCYAVGPISGGHFNPAVTVGLAAANRFECKWVIPYICAQLIGASLAALIIFKIVISGHSFNGFVGTFAANTIQNYSICAGFLIEVVMTFVFLMVIIGSTSENANKAFAPIAIGLALVAIHLVSIPVTNTSVNPARSTSQALFSNNILAIQQLWIFWAAPMLGALIAGLFHRFCCCGFSCKESCITPPKKEAKPAAKPAAKKAKK